ncbi:MAG: DUF3570 domain-containing protein [Nevskiales bacterium]|nr:DUF3570 domain-containing protein [Nevskiales bacterium]
MQLNDKRRALSAATLTLLGGAPAAGHASVLDGNGNWDIDTAVLVYSESDSRVQLVEPVIKGTLNLGGERYLTTKLVLDTLTGASPNGATPASHPQTFTGPSGGSNYTVAAFETPLDDTFKDTRVQGSVDYLFPTSPNGKLGFGLNASSEYDFLSVGANARYAHDFFQHNTTLSAGVSFESDQIDPVGGAPVALSIMPPNAGDGEQEEDDQEGRERSSSESKTVTDLIVGWTQVISPRSLMQVNYSLSVASGYQTDPYKLLSVVGSDGEPLRYIYEGRPDSRNKQALYGRYKRLMFDRDVFDISYRFMTDDWGIDSHTVDLTYRWYFSQNHYLEPHLRWYNQTAADFYHVALYDGQETQVDYASADPRLSELDGMTLGLKVGSAWRNSGNWSARLELYQQQYQDTGIPPEAAQGLSKFDLQPDLTAVMLTLGYRFKW